MRRRQRRLRQWHRHERMIVAMALAEAYAPRRPHGGPKTARAGVRPGVLEGPWGRGGRTEHEQHAALRGTEASVSRGAVAGHACAGWHGRGSSGTALPLSYLLQQSACRHEGGGGEEVGGAGGGEEGGGVAIADRGDQGDGPATCRWLLRVGPLRLLAKSSCATSSRS